MRIAIPVANGQLSPHFGHCEQFALFDVDPDTRNVTKVELQTPPPHEPGILPRWLAEIGATTIIAGGMGMRAQQLFEQNGIKVVIGADGGNPRTIVDAYLSGNLVTGDNLCDH